MVTTRAPQSDGIRAVLSAHKIDYRPGQVPSVKVPFPYPIKSGVAETGKVNSVVPSAIGGGRFNLFGSSAFYKFSLAQPGPVKIEMTITSGEPAIPANLDLYLMGDGGRKELASSTAPTAVGGKEQITQDLPAGRYVVEIRSWSGVVGPGGQKVFSYNRGDYKIAITY